MKPINAVMWGVVCSGCVTVHDSVSPRFGRAPSEVAACEVKVLRGQSAGYEEVDTRWVEGSIFLTQPEIESILRKEACSVHAQAVLITAENYGVPFVGSYAMGTLLKLKATE